MELTNVGKSPSRRLSCKAHRHADWELAYNIRGSGTMTVGERSYPFEPGTILLCPPELYHNKTSSDGFEDIYFHFSGFDYPREVHVLKDSYDRRLLRLLQVLHTTYYESAAPSVCTNLADAILGLVRPMLSGMERTEHVRMLQNRIAESFTDPDFSIREAMSRIPVNPDHLRRLFTKEMGQTPQQYLSHLRLDKAKRLLSEEHEKVAEVAYRCGYYDALYFSKVFRTATGIPPSRWR